MEAASIGTTGRAVALPFALAAVLSAGLLFWVEPLATKLLLPTLGGGAQVWTTALMFFQGALFLGYLYAHLLTRLAAPALQAVIHAAMLALAGLFLPPAVTVTAAGAAAPITAILGALSMALGLPFVVLAATAPLIQHWFGRASGGADPYHLYAASNLGSLGALLAFPFVLEPALSLQDQAWVWSCGFAVVALLTAGCAARAAAVPAPIPEVAAVDPQGRAGEQGAGPAWNWRWLALSAAPASLLSGVTQDITTDIAAMPLLWVIPLALYLVTFILAFARRPILPPRWPVLLLPIAVVPVLAKAFGVMLGGPAVLIVADLATLFLAALGCHQELARLRPPPAMLTRYFLLVAFGGFLGGAFNAVVAPQLFTGIVEFPVALVLAVALRPSEEKTLRWWRDGALPLAVCLAGAAAVVAWPAATRPTAAVVLAAGLSVAAPLMFANSARFATALLGAFLAAGWVGNGHRLLHAERNFYGVVKVFDSDGARLMVNGTTIHGMMGLPPQAADEPLGYYYREGPLGDIFAAFAPPSAGGRVAAVGLGIGSVACYARPGQRWSFFEINPLVTRIAADPALFGLVGRCAPGAEFVEGDARLRLAEASRGPFDLIVLDAFSSDAIPVHLLTAEAFALYRRKLAPHGHIAIHITNRLLDLAPVVAAAAQRTGLAGRVKFGQPPEGAARKAPTRWVVLARAAEAGGLDGLGDGWQTLPPPVPRALWTDGRSDLLYPLLQRLAP